MGWKSKGGLLLVQLDTCMSPLPNRPLTKALVGEMMTAPHAW
jgi:hypothetical protein